ncbi:hypothetical protein HanPI659440_Chr15g0596041 [Helianthus annuus]|nr:hypothetical protein HanPI659440_Chr15g0596041 [Helianthus annuus]
MSFDIGSSTTSTFLSTPQFTNISGINTKHIWHKTLSILNPFQVKPHLHEHADLSGPFLFLMAFGLFQLLAGNFEMES